MYDLNLYNFKLSIYEGETLSDSLIVELIDGFTAEDAIASIFFKYGTIMNSAISYSDRCNFFHNLANQIKRLSGYNYSDDDIMLYTLYATPLYPMSNMEKDTTHAIEMLENSLNLHPSGKNELFAQETLKYRLLHLYAERIDTRYEDMKKLLTDMNNVGQAAYDELKSSVLGKFQ